MDPRALLARLGPLVEPEFRRLYLARAFLLFGDALVPVALAFGVLSVDRSPSALGFVLASRFISLALFLLVAGVIGDRLPRKRILISSDLLPSGRAVPHRLAADHGIREDLGAHRARIRVRRR